jgi:hypothetical protein
MKKLFGILSLFLGGCVSYTPLPDFIPYTSYSSPPRAYSNYSPPPFYSTQQGGYVRDFYEEPVRLQKADNSNVVVYSNRDWWYGGPKRGWIPTGGGWYPQPGELCYEN